MKFCLACGKVKQKCIGMVWGGGAGLNGMLMGADLGELTELVRELVGEMRELKETVERRLKNVVWANHLWYQTCAGCNGLCRVVGGVPGRGSGPGINRVDG